MLNKLFSFDKNENGRKLQLCIVGNNIEFELKM